MGISLFSICGLILGIILLFGYKKCLFRNQPFESLFVYFIIGLLGQIPAIYLTYTDWKLRGFKTDEECLKAYYFLGFGFFGVLRYYLKYKRNEWNPNDDKI
jgi:hypothetical protein